MTYDDGFGGGEGELGIGVKYSSAICCNFSKGSNFGDSCLVFCNKESDKYCNKFIPLLRRTRNMFDE